MRIVGGQFKRKPIKSPRGHLTRPTTERTREAIFNLLEHRMDIEGAHVLDLFAGTGALGLEAISRGAEAVVAVEKNPQVLKVARENARDLGVEDSITFIRGDALQFLKRYQGPPFDIIFADPPYELPGIPRLPDLAVQHLKPGGVFVLEHDVRHRFEGHPLLELSRPYGRTVVSLFRPLPVAPAGEHS